MDKIGFNFLIDEISMREVPLSDSVIDLIHPDRQRALHQFAKLVERATREYDKHYCVSLYKRFDVIQMEGYDFSDNMDAYIAGNIEEKDIELIPEAIALIRSGYSNYPTSNSWIYRKPHLTSVGGVTWVKYYAYHPIRYTLSPDGKFSEDSYIYFVNASDDTFVNQVALEVLTYLKQTRETVVQPTGLQFFDFTQRIADLTASTRDDYATSAELYEMWGR